MTTDEAITEAERLLANSTGELYAFRHEHAHPGGQCYRIDIRGNPILVNGKIVGSEPVCSLYAGFVHFEGNAAAIIGLRNLMPVVLAALAEARRQLAGVTAKYNSAFLAIHAQSHPPSVDDVDVQIKRLIAERDALRRQLDRWEDYYGCEEPSDSVIGSAAGKIVAERNVEIATLKRELSSYIRVHGCISCGEQHGGMCPPHEVRTTGMAAVNGVKDRLIGELRRQLADAEKERDDWKESLRKAEANYCQHWRPELCAPPTAIRADAPSVQADVFDQRVADVPKQAETPATVTEGEYRAFGHILARMATPDHALRLAKFDDSDECSCICAALNAKRHDDAAVERLVEALRLCLMCGLPPHDISGQRMWQQARDALAPFGTEGSVE